MTRQLPQNLRQGIAAAKSDKFLVGLTLLGNFYDQPGNQDKLPEGLSWYGFCLAMIQKNYDHAIECCKVALEKQPDHPAHYLNLGKVYLASGNRKKAVQTTDEGLALRPHDSDLIAFRRQLGVRARPVLGFLDRSHPVNITIGQVRQTIKKKSGPGSPRR